MARTGTERRPDTFPSLELATQLHVALDNMPGALVYTDEALNIVFCNVRFREMYDRLESCFSLDNRIRIFFATWPSTAITAKAIPKSLSRNAWKAYKTHLVKRSKT